MIPSSVQVTKTMHRFVDRTSPRTRNIQLIGENRFVEADSPDRIEKFLARRAFSTTETQEIVNFSHGIGLEKLQHQSPKSPVKILERIIAANDLLDISFINKAVISSRAVGRVWISNMFNRIENYGTGFMISPSLMLTNNHVLPDAGVAAYSKFEMNYEFDNHQVLRKTDLYNLDPATFFLTNVDLDYTIVAVNPNIVNGFLQFSSFLTIMCN